MRLLAPALTLFLLSAPPILGAQAPADPPHRAVAIRWEHLAFSIGAVAIATTFDAPLARQLGHDPSPGLQQATTHLKRFGEVGVIAPVIGSMALAGALTGRREFTEAAQQTVGAIAISTVAVSAGKLLLGRARPYQDDALDGGTLRPLSGQTALPSGHTAAAFALATSLSDAVGHPAATIGFFGLAAGTGFARIAANEHWFSDVVAGAIVGTVSARLAQGRVGLLGLPIPTFRIGRDAAAVHWQVELPVVR